MWSDALDRYKTPVADIFSLENKLHLQLRIEATLADIQADLGIIKKKHADAIKHATKSVSISRVMEIEREIHHDLMAMVRALAEQSGVAGKYVHLGATSNDIQDTTLALQLVETKNLILNLFDELSEGILELTEKYQNTACIGRTHGQHAVPTTLGFKFANYLYELQIAKETLYEAKVNVSKFSGAVGNYAALGTMQVESNLLSTLGLEPVKISTQVVTRLIHAKFLNGLALLASVMERLSKEIRHLQRSEIQELYEPFSERQVGSSSMPHKRNPHKSERINGLSRIIRNNVNIALENIALEHERDISHSSVERIIIPESSNLLYFIGVQMKKILKGLTINREAIEENLKKSSDISKSEQILKALVPSIGRQKGHELLRKHNVSKNYREAILNDDEILKYITEEKLEEIFNDISTGLSEEKVQRIINLYKSKWTNYRN